MCWSLVTSGAETPCASTTMWPTRSRFVTCLLPSTFRLEPRFFSPPTDVSRCSLRVLISVTPIGKPLLHGSNNVKRSEEHTSELQSHLNLVCRLLLEKKKNTHLHPHTPSTRSPSRTP